MLSVADVIFKKGHIYWIITFLILALILWGTLSPPNRIELPDIGSDKTQHFLAFAALVSPLILYNLKNIFWLTPLALLLGALIELIQPVFDRHRDISDFYADALGVLFSVTVISTAKLIFKRNN